MPMANKPTKVTLKLSETKKHSFLYKVDPTTIGAAVQNAYVSKDAFEGGRADPTIVITIESGK